MNSCLPVSPEECVHIHLGLVQESQVPCSLSALHKILHQQLFDEHNIVPLQLLSVPLPRSPFFKELHLPPFVFGRDSNLPLGP